LEYSAWVAVNEAKKLNDDVTGKSKSANWRVNTALQTPLENKSL
jgi:hypothetical protein